MKVLLTGAFGNVGTSTLKELVKRNHSIRCFDIPTKKNKHKAKKFAKYTEKVEFFWGDLRTYADVEKAVQSIDVIIHLGAIIPPFANERPDIAERVNVGGTKNIITASQNQPNPPKLIFSSSVAIYGDVRHKGTNYIIKTSDELRPSPHDQYARQKIKCEKMIRESELEWIIFRFAAIPPFDQGPDPFMFEVPLDTPIEFCHTLDTGFALANAIVNKEIWGKILHIGGGPACRLPFSEYAGRVLDEIGIGRLPEEAFGTKPFHCGYMDTEESQRLLQYQRLTYDEYLKDIKKKYSFAKPFILLCRPLIRAVLLKKSQYYKTYKKTIKEYIHPKNKLIKAKPKTQPNKSATENKS